MPTPSDDFDRFAGYTAVAVGIGGLAYSIAFVTYLQSGSTAAASSAGFFGLRMIRRPRYT